jgi:hypothetical protein
MIDKRVAAQIACSLEPIQRQAAELGRMMRRMQPITFNGPLVDVARHFGTLHTKGIFDNLNAIEPFRFKLPWDTHEVEVELLSRLLKKSLSKDVVPAATI